MTGAEIVLEALEREGVDRIFGYPGGANLPIYQQLPKYPQLQHVLVRHEQGAAHMADGFARASGRPGVVFATSGPGALNTITGLCTAYMDSVPLVAITGQQATNLVGRDAFQESDVIGCSMPVTKHNYMITRVDDIARVIHEAFHIATSGRPGPVLIDVCKDVQQKSVVPNWDPPTDLPGYRPLRKVTRAELEAVIAAIRASKKPFIYAGGGVTHSGAAAELKEFAELIGAPVGLTVHGLGNFPSDHYLCLQMLGMHGTVYSNYAINDADLLLALGVRFDDRVTGKLTEFAKHGKIVHIDIDPSELNKNKFAHLPIHADVNHALHD